VPESELIDWRREFRWRRGKNPRIKLPPRLELGPYWDWRSGALLSRDVEDDEVRRHYDRYQRKGCDAAAPTPSTPAAQRFAQASTLVEVLALALDDFENVLDDPRYAIDLDHRSWHRPSENRCFVCLSGSVMAKRLGADIEHVQAPEDFAAELQLVALDDLQTGCVDTAADRLDRWSADKDVIKALTAKWRPILILQYVARPVLTAARARRFLAAMRTMQCDLEAAEL
jgi:hypothetical protein